jgi:SNF2 family DNA or RNA helicase
MRYEDFLKKKEFTVSHKGIEVEKLNNHLFDYQKAIVKWALRKGKAALFEDTGLGKTIQQLSWADEVHRYTKKPVLILAPLAVSEQTAKEALKFDIQCKLCESQEDVVNGINITNYEKIHKFDTDCFTGIVLDESSIIKSYSGKTTKDLQERFAKTPFKLCCTATPSPNDYTEIGTTS